MTKNLRIASLQPLVSMAPATAAPITDDWKDDRRGSRHERGYGSAWDRLRLTILKRDRYLCQCSDCRAKGRTRPASHVDHITSKAQWRIERGTLDGVDDPSNLQAINKDCHALKTQRDRQAAYGRDKGPGG